jgi:hypothetical protein
MNVRECENEHSHSKVSSHFRNWSPGGLSNLQRVIAGVKTHWIGEFLISLQSYRNVDVQNGLTRPIWTLQIQVMAKRNVGSQIDNLTPDHKKSRIDLISLCAGGVKHIVEKLLTRAITLLQTSY